MNLIDNEINEKKEQNNKIIKIVGVAIIVLIVVAIALMSYLSYEKSKQFKFLLDGNKSAISSDLLHYDNDILYVSIKDLSNLLQKKSIVAEYNNGTYKEYNEDDSECYVKQQYEVAGFKYNSNEIYKVMLEDESYEYYNIKIPVKRFNGKLYTTEEGIEIGFNIKMSYDEESNTLSMRTLDNLVEYYAKTLDNNVINSKTMSFSNKKALKYNLIIVSNGNENNKNNKVEYGVRKIVNNENRISYGSDIIGIKYSNLKFLESTQDFIVTTSDDKQGIIATNKNKKNIEPRYSELKKIHDDFNLFLVKNDKDKYGVYDREKQRAIIPIEYDSIGVDTAQFKNEKIENQYILFDNFIPCKKSESDGTYKWELIDVNGNKIIDQKFDAIGYIKGTSKDAKGDNLLLIPEIESIIVNKDSKYAIVNSIGQIISNIQQIYVETSEGKNTYYIVYNNQTINLLETLKSTNFVTNNNTTNNNQNSTNNDKNNESADNN